MNVWTSVLFAADFCSLNIGVMNGTMTKNASFPKHLGLIFSNTGHVKSISEKSWSRLNLLRAPKFSFEKIFGKYALHISLLEYSDTVGTLVFWIKNIIRCCSCGSDTNCHRRYEIGQDLKIIYGTWLGVAPN